MFGQPVNDKDILYVDQGSHKFKPYSFRWTRKSILVYEYDFSPNVAYSLPTGQCSWNKGGGLSASLWSNHVNSLMWAWRYDISGTLIIAPYYHKDRKTKWANAPCTSPNTLGEGDPNIPYLQINPTESFQVHFNRQSKTVVSMYIVTAGNESLFFEVDFPKANFNRWREIGMWFGGQHPSPQLITCGRTCLAFE